MINKITDKHFSALYASFSNTGKPAGIDVKLAVSNTSEDAISSFMAAPSFSTKQVAIETLLKQITQGISPSYDKTGATG